MKTAALFALLLLLTATVGSAATCTHRAVSATTATQITAALNNAQAGDIITVAAGSYTGTPFTATSKSGTADCPITLTSGGAVSLVGSTTDGGYVLYFVSCSHWIVNGSFTLTNAQKGLVLDGSSNNMFNGLTVTKIGDEGVLFRKDSCKNTLRSSTVTNTGLFAARYGEGVYIGQYYGNWDPSGVPDRSDYNIVEYCTIGPNVRAEAVDIKEGTTGGLIRYNTFNAQGISGQNYADSWVDVQGNSYIIVGNTGNNPEGSSGKLVDGIQVHNLYSGWGLNNTIIENTLNVDSTGWGIYVEDSLTGNVVCLSNVVNNAAKGFADNPNGGTTVCPKYVDTSANAPTDEPKTGQDTGASSTTQLCSVIITFSLLLLSSLMD